MSEPEPSTSMATPTKFSVATLTSPAATSSFQSIQSIQSVPPLPHQLPAFPPMAFLQLVSQYMARNSFNQSAPSVNLSESPLSPIDTPQSPERKRKRKRRDGTKMSPGNSRDSGDLRDSRGPGDLGDLGDPGDFISPKDPKDSTNAKDPRNPGDLGNLGDPGESPDEEIASTATVVEPKDVPEKEVAQQLLQNALSQAGQMRAERMSSTGRKSLSASPPATESADVDDVKRIKTHPLFPILKLFGEKIEMATSEMKSSTFKMDDVEKLFADLEAKGISAKTGDFQLDQFVYDSIFVLRLQLAEIARVASLSEEFKQNFAASLRKRVNHETLIGVLGDSDEDASTSDGESTSRGALGDGSTSNTTVAMMRTPNGTLSIPLTMPPITHLSRESQGSPPGKRGRFGFSIDESSNFLNQVGSSNEI